MKKVVGIGLVALLAVAAHASGGQVVGQGGFYFGDRGVTAFTLRANTARPEQSVMQFAADGLHTGDLPDAVIILERTDHLSVGARTMLLVGTGSMHGTPVRIRVYAYDGAGTNNPDRFEIWTRSNSGQLLFHMDGDVEVGDISINRN